MDIQSHNDVLQHPAIKPSVLYGSFSATTYSSRDYSPEPCVKMLHQHIHAPHQQTGSLNIGRWSLLCPHPTTDLLSKSCSPTTACLLWPACCTKTESDKKRNCATIASRNLITCLRRSRSQVGQGVHSHGYFETAVLAPFPCLAPPPSSLSPSETTPTHPHYYKHGRHGKDDRCSSGVHERRCPFRPEVHQTFQEGIPAVDQSRRYGLHHDGRGRLLDQADPHPNQILNCLVLLCFLVPYI